MTRATAKKTERERKKKKRENRVYFEKTKRERRWKRSERGMIETRQRKYIKFNLNQLSFIDVARISDTCHQKLDTCTWLHLPPFISISHCRSRASALSPSHRCCMSLSLCPRCLFTSQLLLFLLCSFARVRCLFRSDNRSSRQSISSGMRPECLESPERNADASVLAARLLTTSFDNGRIRWKQSDIFRRKKVKNDSFTNKI